MSSDLANIGLAAIGKIGDIWASGRAQSLIDYTKPARVEPLCLVDADCLYQEATPDVMQSLLSIFSAYYLQAVALSLSVGKVEVMRHLDKLNPTRDPLNSAADFSGVVANHMLARESYQWRLPTPDDAARLALEQGALALEANHRDNHFGGSPREEREGRKEQRDAERFEFDLRNAQADRQMREDERQARAAEVQRNYELNKEKFGHEKAMAKAQKELQDQGLKLQEAKRQDSLNASEVGFGRDTLATLKENSNLSVGKLLSVDLTDGLHKASIVVAVRLLASSLPSSSLVHILSFDNEDTSFKERYHAWKSGRLQFWRDLVMCQDLIDAHKKQLMADKDGMYTTILRRSRANQLSAIVSANPSVATASNLVVLSDTTAADLELKINGQLKDFATREKIFKKTYLMIMAVVDKQWQRVTFYHRGIHGETVVGVRELKAANKGSGPDVSDILRAYSLGQSPSL